MDLDFLLFWDNRHFIRDGVDYRETFDFEIETQRLVQKRHPAFSLLCRALKYLKTLWFLPVKSCILEALAMQYFETQVALGTSSRTHLPEPSGSP
jgi:hypothetical protein